MGIIKLPKNWLGKAASKGTLFSMIGGFAAGKLMERNRKRWELAKSQEIEALLDQITTYDVSRGAGKLLAGWLAEGLPKLNVQSAEAQLKDLLQQMDQDDDLPEERARSRFIVSKVLFYIEGFKLTHCRYENYQRDALRLLHKNPRLKKLNRNDIFRGLPFEPEDIIATTHRMLLMLDNGHLVAYIRNFMLDASLRSDTDYMARLIATTLAAKDAALPVAIHSWFQEFCDFKIAQSHHQEALIHTSINTATGGLPASIGIDLLGRAIQTVNIRKK